MARRAQSEHQKTVEARRLLEQPGLQFAIGRKQQSLIVESATDRLATFLQTLPDPDLTLKAAGLTRADLRRLTKDDEVTQCWEKRVEAVAGMPWRLEPNNSRASHWLTEEIEPHIHDLIVAAMDAVFYGYSVQEVIYRDGARIGIDRISHKPFEWFFFNAAGELRYRPNDGSGGTEGLPCDPRKFLLSRNRASYSNPYGEALVSRLWWPVFYRAQLWAFRMQALERYGTPLTIGKTMGDRSEFANQLAQLASNAVVAIGDQDSVEFAEAAQPGKAFSEAEAELVSRIQKLILGQTLTSEIGGTGSYAAAEVHYRVMQDKRNADIRMISSAIQRLIDSLSELNGIDAPLFVMADDTGLEMARAERDKILVEAGALKLTKEYLLDRYDFEEGDFEIGTQPSSTPAPAIPAPEAGQDGNDAENISTAATGLTTFRKRKAPAFTPQQQAIEDAADALLEKAPEPIPLDAMLTAVKAATDPADLAVRLSLLLDQQDPRFTELLARAQFAAATLGYVVAEQEAPTPKSSPVPMAAAPTTMNLTVHAPITMAAPEAQPTVVNVAAPTVINQIPEQPAPIVNVQAGDVSVQVPEQQAPIINLEVQPAPIGEIAIVSMPERVTETSVTRDKAGNILKTTQTETDASPRQEQA